MTTTKDIKKRIEELEKDIKDYPNTKEFISDRDTELKILKEWLQDKKESEICSTCGFPKNMERVPIILKNDIFSLSHYFANVCPECKSQKNGITIKPVWGFIQQFGNDIIKNQKESILQKIKNKIKETKEFKSKRFINGPVDVLEDLKKELGL